MNTPGTFKMGWALFAGCFLTGAGIGYMQAVQGQEQRTKDLVKQVADRNASLDKLEAKWRSEGSKKFKLTVQKNVDSSDKDIEKERPP